jgi:hypothetical protein
MGKPEVNGVKIIVSLTSFPARINSVWMVIESMKRQTKKPSKIILWLSRKQFPNECDIPISILNRQDDLFEIRMVDGDIKSHKKYYYVLQDYPDAFIVTVDDDIFYPSYLIEKLYEKYEMEGGIICSWASRYFINSNGLLAPYNEWPKIEEETSNRVFFGSGGGTLFPPDSLYEDALKIDLCLQLCPIADDIWLNAMAKLNQTGITYVPVFRNILNIIYLQKTPKLSSQNVVEGRNDEQIKKIIEYYEQPVWL